jgi:tRNA-Thr(GGU) m(6)t(6)A37 methyltransferase TsaA
MSIAIEPIGVVRSSRSVVEDDDWDAEQVRIELDASRFGSDALLGITLFSHVEVIFLMDRVEPAKIEIGARRPRNNPAWPEMGIFAQRGKNRPNRIGTTICRVIGVKGTTLEVAGLDAVDGTPVLDIKPWLSDFGPRGTVFEPEWARELMSGYWKR